jgi:curved DNA-binding protein CbpA
MREKMDEQKARDILRVSAGDSFEKVRRNYHALAKKYHPDRNPGDLDSAENCKRVIEAYNFLCKVKKQTKTQEELRMEQHFWNLFREFWPIPLEFEGSGFQVKIKKDVSCVLSYDEPYERFAKRRGFYDFVSP